MTKVFVIVIITILATQTSASFFDTMRGAFQPLENSVSKLFSDVVSDLRTTIDCTILAVEQVFSWQAMFGKTVEYYDQRCSGRKDKVPPPNDTYVESAKGTLIKENDVKELEATINKSVPNSQERQIIEDAFKNETLRLQQIHKIICEELDKLTADVENRIKKLDHEVATAETVLSEVRQLYEIEQHDKSSSRANEVRQTFDKVLTLLQVNDTGGVYSDDDEVKVIMKGIGNSLGSAIDDVEIQFMEWKKDGKNKTKNSKNSIQEHIMNKQNKDGSKLKRESNAFEAEPPHMILSDVNAEILVNSEATANRNNSLDGATKNNNSDTVVKVLEQSPDLFLHQRTYQMQNTDQVIKHAIYQNAETITPEDGSKSGAIEKSLPILLHNEEDTQLTLRSLIDKDFDYTDEQSQPQSTPDSKSRGSLQVQNKHLEFLNSSLQGTNITTSKDLQKNQEGNAPEYKQLTLDGVQFRKAADILLSTQVVSGLQGAIKTDTLSEIKSDVSPAKETAETQSTNEFIRNQCNSTQAKLDSLQNSNNSSFSQLKFPNASDQSTQEIQGKVPSTYDETQPLQDNSHVLNNFSMQSVQTSNNYSSTPSMANLTEESNDTSRVSGVQLTNESSQVSSFPSVSPQTQENSQGPIFSGITHPADKSRQTPKEAPSPTDIAHLTEGSRGTALDSSGAQPKKVSNQNSSITSVSPLESREGPIISGIAHLAEERKQTPSASEVEKIKVSSQASSTATVARTPGSKQDPITSDIDHPTDKTSKYQVPSISNAAHPTEDSSETPNASKTKQTKESTQTACATSISPLTQRSSQETISSGVEHPIEESRQIFDAIGGKPKKESSQASNITIVSPQTQESSQSSITSGISYPSQDSKHTLIASDTQETNESSQASGATSISPLIQGSSQDSSTSGIAKLSQESSQVLSTSNEAPSNQESSEVPSSPHVTQSTPESSLVSSTSNVAQATKEISQTPTNPNEAQSTQESSQDSTTSGIAKLTQGSSQVPRTSNKAPSNQESSKVPSSPNVKQSSQESSLVSSTSNEAKATQEISSTPIVPNEEQITQESGQASSTSNETLTQESGQAVIASDIVRIPEISQVQNYLGISQRHMEISTLLRGESSQPSELASDTLVFEKSEQSTQSADVPQMTKPNLKNTQSDIVTVPLQVSEVDNSSGNFKEYRISQNAFSKEPESYMESSVARYVTNSKVNTAQIPSDNSEEKFTTPQPSTERQYVPSPKFKPVLNNNEQAESNLQKASVDNITPAYSSENQYVPSPKFNAVRDKNMAIEPVLEPFLTSSVTTSGYLPEKSDDTFETNESSFSSLRSFMEKSDQDNLFMSAFGNQDFSTYDVFTTPRSDFQIPSEAILDAQAIINDSQLSESLMDNLFVKQNHQHNVFEEPEMLYN